MCKVRHHEYQLLGDNIVYDIQDYIQKIQGKLLGNDGSMEYQLTQIHNVAYSCW